MNIDPDDLKNKDWDLAESRGIPYKSTSSSLNIEDFLLQPAFLLDVRSPQEYAQGHIPGAYSFPLFSDDERAQVGKMYKMAGKEAAVRLGLRFICPRLPVFIDLADQLADETKTFRLYCWRGGMRSASLAWLLETAGYSCQLLTGGYKMFRRWALEQFEKKYFLVVLGGCTGSGKTEALKILKHQNEQVIDLEDIARHQGSSYGHLAHVHQPSNEQFTNLLAWQLNQYNARLPIWIEDESRMIGTCQIPSPFWEQMMRALLVWFQVPKENRIQRLKSNYGQYPKERLIEATRKIEKKLGAVKTNQVVELIKNCQIEEAISAILDYYDRTYLHARQRRQQEIFFCSIQDSAAMPEICLNIKNKLTNEVGLLKTKRASLNGA